MPDLVLIVAVGTFLLLLLGVFITFMALTYQKRRLEHQEKVRDLAETYQKEVLKSQIEVQEQTFLSISQEIHDNVGQLLSLVRLNMSTIRIAEASTAEQKVNNSKELLDQAIEDLRDLSKRLNSNYTASQSLPSLLEFQLDLIRKTGVIDTKFTMSGEEMTLNPEKKLITYRIMQEALNNIIRHAQAKLISAQFEYTDGKLRIKISDDGIGFSLNDGTQPGILSKGTGTGNMNLRAKLIGATLRIRSAPGTGTSILLELPY